MRVRVRVPSLFATSVGHFELGTIYVSDLFIKNRMPLQGMVRDAMHARVLASQPGRRFDAGLNPGGAVGAAVGQGSASF